MITGETKFCFVVGGSTTNSLSPIIHNAAYKALGFENKFVYGAINTEGDAKDVIEAMRALDIKGYSVTIPYKEIIVPHLDWVEKNAKTIGAVNTVVNQNRIIKGFNTDWVGGVAPLKKVCDLKGKKTAIIGAGGAARAIVFGLRREGANISYIFDKSRGRATKLAKDLCPDCEVEKMDKIEKAGDADIIINATPVGMKGTMENKTPLPKAVIKPRHIIFDIVYCPEKTVLLKEAAQRKAKVVYGTEMLIHQAILQVEMHTGCRMNEELSKKVVNAVNNALKRSGVVAS